MQNGKHVAESDKSSAIKLIKANGKGSQQIDMRSDTVTLPSQQMRTAAFEAEVGDDVYGEDPSVNHLQEVAAEMLGTEAALFVCSGTMGNLSAVLAHCEQRGCEVIVGDESHVYNYEAGGMSVLGGIAFNVLPNLPTGEIPLERLAKAIRPDDEHFPRSACLCLENTHNRCGGKVLSLEYMSQVKQWADSQGIPIHLDGARIFNASQALDVPVSEIVSHVTSVQLCLSKGLGAPAGSIVAGPKAFIKRVHRYRKMLGGGMRQSGIMAAPGLIALTEMSKRLGEDHRNAQILAKGLAEQPLIELNPADVHSNIVVFKLRPESHHTPASFAVALQSKGVMMIPFVEGTVRAVTHVNISEEDIENALQAVRDVLKDCPGSDQNRSQVKSPYGDW